MNLYVGNLPFSATESSLQELFERHGKVDSVTLPVDRDTGRSRGFAFIAMPDDDARKAIAELDGENFSGRDLRVNEARPRT